MTTYAIGDVQGCFDSLMRLLESIHFDASHDTLWFVGDLVNRGPRSLDVLRFVHGLGPRAITVLGNHDLHLLAVYDGGQVRRNDTLADVLAAPDCAALMDWLAQQPLMHVDRGLGFTMTHAGIPSLWHFDEANARAREIESVLRGSDRGAFLRAMYGNEPARWTDTLTGTDRLRVITNYFTRMRVVDDNCGLDLNFKEAQDAIPAGYHPWFVDYLERDLQTRLVFGHWAALDGRCDVPGIFAIDTGCVWGGKLTALRLVDQERFSVGSVQ